MSSEPGAQWESTARKWVHSRKLFFSHSISLGIASVFWMRRHHLWLVVWIHELMDCCKRERVVGRISMPHTLVQFSSVSPYINIYYLAFGVPFSHFAHIHNHFPCQFKNHFSVSFGFISFLMPCLIHGIMSKWYAICMCICLWREWTVVLRMVVWQCRCWRRPPVLQCTSLPLYRVLHRWFF